MTWLPVVLTLLGFNPMQSAQITATIDAIHAAGLGSLRRRQGAVTALRRSPLSMRHWGIERERTDAAQV